MGNYNGNIFKYNIFKIIKIYIFRVFKNKNIKVSSALIKESLVFFVNSVIVNPSFSSQTKDTLTTKVKDLQAAIVDAQEDGLEYSDTASVLHEINSRIVVLENIYFRN